MNDRKEVELSNCQKVVTNKDGETIGRRWGYRIVRRSISTKVEKIATDSRAIGGQK
jgi:hypothetical protein